MYPATCDTEYSVGVVVPLLNDIEPCAIACDPEYIVELFAGTPDAYAVPTLATRIFPLTVPICVAIFVLSVAYVIPSPI